MIFDISDLLDWAYQVFKIARGIKMEGINVGKALYEKRRRFHGNCGACIRINS